MPRSSCPVPRQRLRRHRNAVLEAPITNAADTRIKKRPDARYDPSPTYVVEEMLWMGGVTERDTVYDLGCGDGRIVIGAARLGARGVGVDCHPRRLELCRENAARARVTDRVRFIQADLFEVDVRKATVVMVYLLPELNVRLRDKLIEQLPAGARIVSHSHDMGDWWPDRVKKVGKSFVYVWNIDTAPGRGAEPLSRRQAPRGGALGSSGQLPVVPSAPDQ